MNIADEFVKRSKTIQFPLGSELKVFKEYGHTYRCVYIKARHSAIIPNAHRIRHLNNTRMPGLLVRACQARKDALTSSIISSKSEATQLTAINCDCFSPLLLPSRLQLEAPFSPYTLHFFSEVDFLICSPPRISRSNFLNLAKGNGVEIGPGPSPQIHNSSTASVRYIEEKPAEEWRKLYGDFDQNKANLWKYYQVGKASEIDQPDGSLDFIFASHVFEHLHNPLGHLKYWSGKLRTAGLVLLIIPAQSGTKDHRQNFTRHSRLAAEELGGAFEPTKENYLEWGSGRDLEYIQELMRQKASIHVHTYDYESIVPLVEEILAQGVFSDYMLDYLPCTKDFLLALKK